MIDTGEDGYIEPWQFIGPMTRWVHESKTAPRFIKYNMHRSVIMQEERSGDRFEGVVLEDPVLSETIWKSWCKALD